MSRRLASFVIVFASALGSCLVTANDLLDDAQRTHLATQLPKLSAKLQSKLAVHVTILGDASVINGPEREPGMVETFLAELQKSFYYTAGVYHAYDRDHLHLPGPKITFETLPLGQPAVPNLVQYTSTLAFVNEPDLLVVCSGNDDFSRQISLPTHRRFFQQILELTKSNEAELIVIGPSLIRLSADRPPSLQPESRPYAASLRQWCQEQRVPYVDPNSSLLPESLLFSSRDNAAKVWERLTTAFRETVHPRLASVFGPRQQKKLGKAVFDSLINPIAPSKTAASRYGLSTSVVRRTESGNVELETVWPVKPPQKLKGFIYPLFNAIDDSREGPLGIAFETVPDQPMILPIELSRPDVFVERQMLYGMQPMSLLVVDPFRLELHDLDVHLDPIGVEWQNHAIHNNNGTVEVRCLVHRFDSNVAELRYQLRCGDAHSTGTLRFRDSEPAAIVSTFTLPVESGETTHNGTFELLLGEGESAVKTSRQYEATRHFALDKPIVLTKIGPPEPAPVENPLEAPEVSLTAEANPDDLLLHFDFRNIALASGTNEPAVKLALALDARPHRERNQLGFVGRLLVHADSSDGPATVGPFEPQAHFGNGYARAALPHGTRALLSTRPNGARRLTVHMSRHYFYLHPWSLGNGNSQLGIDAFLELNQSDTPNPVVYRLIESPLHPNNAESLAVLELTEKETKRWSIRFWSTAEGNDPPLPPDLN